MVLGEMLSGKTYNSEETASWTRDISDTIKKRLKGMQCLKKKLLFMVYAAAFSSHCIGGKYVSLRKNEENITMSEFK